MPAQARAATAVPYPDFSAIVDAALAAADELDELAAAEAWDRRRARVQALRAEAKDTLERLRAEQDRLVASLLFYGDGMSISELSERTLRSRWSVEQIYRRALGTGTDTAIIPAQSVAKRALAARRAGVEEVADAAVRLPELVCALAVARSVLEVAGAAEEGGRPFVVPLRVTAHQVREKLREVPVGPARRRRAATLRASAEREAAALMAQRGRSHSPSHHSVGRALRLALAGQRIEVATLRPTTRGGRPVAPPPPDLDEIRAAARAQVEAEISAESAFPGRLRRVLEVNRDARSSVGSLGHERMAMAMSLHLHDGVKGLHTSLGIARSQMVEMRWKALGLAPKSPLPSANDLAALQEAAERSGIPRIPDAGARLPAVVEAFEIARTRAEVSQLLMPLPDREQLAAVARQEVRQELGAHADDPRWRRRYAVDLSVASVGREAELRAERDALLMALYCYDGFRGLEGPAGMTPLSFQQLRRSALCLSDREPLPAEPEAVEHAARRAGVAEYPDAVDRLGHVIEAWIVAPFRTQCLLEALSGPAVTGISADVSTAGGEGVLN
ncbi:hypothetical protein ABZW18_00445 [Streptomyces sp. NPDC004647]|uniref:hypothetical protein n=1 Tax=Streptomyces sp. NPDC004647 TaxID=3154671 RepID=UPI0033AAFCA6